MKIKAILALLIPLCLLVFGCDAVKKPPDGGTVPPGTEEVTTSAPDTAAWYLQSQTDRVLETLSVPAELSGYAVKLPFKYTETSGGIVFTFDFFQEYYPLGSLIQLSVEVTNNTGSDIEFIGNNSPGGFSDGEKNLSIVGITADQEAYFAMQSVEKETIKAGETHIYERLYYTRPDFFKPGKKITYFFYFFEVLGPSYKIEFPVEVVKLN